MKNLNLTYIIKTLIKGSRKPVGEPKLILWVKYKVSIFDSPVSLLDAFLNVSIFYEKILDIFKSMLYNIHYGFGVIAESCMGGLAPIHLKPINEEVMV